MSERRGKRLAWKGSEGDSTLCWNVGRIPCRLLKGRGRGQLLRALLGEMTGRGKKEQTRDHANSLCSAQPAGCCMYM